MIYSKKVHIFLCKYWLLCMNSFNCFWSYLLAYFISIIINAKFSLFSNEYNDEQLIFWFYGDNINEFLFDDTLLTEIKRLTTVILYDLEVFKFALPHCDAVLCKTKQKNKIGFVLNSSLLMKINLSEIKMFILFLFHEIGRIMSRCRTFTNEIPYILSIKVYSLLIDVK